MTNLTERLNSADIANQVHQITQYYNCSPFLRLWMKFIKPDGLLTPQGRWFVGFSMGLFLQGISTEREAQYRLCFLMATSTKVTEANEDFENLLSSYHYAEPKSVDEAITMIKT